jgi:hypothetical protein
MDDYRQDCGHISNGLTANILKALTPEEKATHRRWTRAVLGFYCSLLLLLGGMAILANHWNANSNSVMAQVSTPRKAP